MSYTLWIIAGSLTFYAVLVMTAVGWLAVCRRRYDPLRAAKYTPPVSLLKPLKGLDDSLEQNLESFARLDYPKFELLLAAADADDPALEVARRVQQRHPQVDIRVLVLGSHLGRNPKVSLLDAMYRLAKYELIMTGDSNVRVRRDFLSRCVQAFRDPRVGLIHNPVVGSGEQTLCATAENLHLTAFTGVLGIVAHVCGCAAVTGKNMIMRRQALDQAGGFRAVRNAAADDQMLAIHVQQAGWRVTLVPEPVESVNATWSWDKLVQRHVRWEAIRLRLAPGIYPLELLGCPFALALLAAPFCGFAMAPWLLLGTLLAKATLNAVACVGLRGRLPRLDRLLLSPLKDGLMFVLWFVPLQSNMVYWRGHRLRMAHGSRLVDPDVWNRAMAIARRRYQRPTFEEVLMPLELESTVVAPAEPRQAA